MTTGRRVLFGLGCALICILQACSSSNDDNSGDNTGSSAAVPESIGIAGSTVKFRPDTAVPAAQTAEIEAARNEFEPFQVAMRGGSGSATLESAVLSNLTNNTGTVTMSTEKTVIYREALYYAETASNLEGDAGYWPDALVPDIDPYYHEKRNAFPMEIPADETRAIWVDLYVPQDTQAGTYQGSLTMTFAGGGTVDIPVTLTVRDFTLPSTSSQRSTFGIRWDVCGVHLGGYSECGDSGTEDYLVRYATAGLDHRLSLGAIYVFPSGDSWDHFDEVYGPLIEGTANTLLPGAQWTTVPFNSTVRTAESMGKAQDHFDSKGWSDTTKLFFYTKDEPSQSDPDAWDWIETYGAMAQAGNMASLVTTTHDTAVNMGVIDFIDILVPLMNYTDGDARLTYDSWLQQPGKDLWWYISCMSHGCGGSHACETSTNQWTNNWPSYVIDASALQARAMEWYAFTYNIHGKLHYETTHLLDTAWDTQCEFGGHGDGTLFYPGTPDRIGGTNHIPVTSIRLKLIREGLEDYEYLHMLQEMGDRAYAVSESASLFQWHAVNDTTVENLFATRRRLAERIESLN